MNVRLNMNTMNTAKVLGCAGVERSWVLSGMVLLLGSLALPAILHAQTVVVPPAYQGTDAGGGSGVLNNNIRLQEIYDASALPGGPIIITEVRFRPSARYGAAFTATISNINIRLSTTPVAPVALSPTFAQNVGSNETVVFNGALPLSSAFSGAASGPKAFDMVVTLTTPFTYDPAAGNLLIDFRNYSSSTATHVDAGASPDRKANRAFAVGADSTTATTVDFGSDVLQFAYTPVSSPPVILSQPASRSVVLGSTAAFSVTAASAVPLSYQWQRDGTDLPSATGASLVLNEVQFGDAGNYAVVVANQFGSVTSSNALLAVTTPPPPAITTQPAGQTVVPGGVAVFSVGVASAVPPVYQWSKDGASLGGATNASLVLSNVQNADAGGYSAVASTAFGSATSVVAVLTVTNSTALVVHPRFAQSEGGGGSSSLFNTIRLQEAYSSTFFPAGQILITELRWRPSVGYGGPSATVIGDLQLNLSTTTRSPGGLSSTFSDNIGTDDTLVFHGSLSVTSAFTAGAGGTKAFDITVPLSTPFLYDSSMGNLLLDIRSFSGSTVSAVDAGGGADQLIGRKFALGANSSTASSGDSGADVLSIGYSSAVIPPYITTQPQSQNVLEGRAATLSVTARGALPLTYQWHFSGSPIADATSSSLGLSNVAAAAAGDYFVVVANALGSVTSHVARLTVDMSRMLSLIAPSQRQEGTRITVLVNLDSDGDVGGMTFLLSYNTNYLKEAQLTWSPDLDGLFNSVNYSPTGQVRATFALPATAVPVGEHTVAAVDFLLRSVPADLDTTLALQILDASDPLGDPIPRGNLASNATVRITKRLFTGDNNANQRLDVGDATVILRHLAGQEQTRAWDVTGNDLNSNASLDSGDAIKVLRAAAGIDPQPGGGGGVAFAPAGHPPGFDVLPTEVILLSPSSVRSNAGSFVTFQISLRDIRTGISGAAFTLDYPTNALRLLNSSAYRSGALIPGGALAIWNVAPSQNNFATQNGRLSLAISSAGAWPARNGVLAEVTFQVQAGAATRYLWPVTLRGAEVTPDGYGNRMLLASGAVLIGRDPVQGSASTPRRNTSGFFEFIAVGDAGARYVIESSSDLTHWNPIRTFLNTTGSYPFEDPASETASHQFYRVRLSGN